MHVGGEDGYDYEYFSEDRDQIFKHINAVFKSLTGNDVPIYGVHGGLSHYKSSKSDAKGGHIKGLPPDEYKLVGDKAIPPVKDVWSKSSKEEGGLLGFFKTVSGGGTSPRGASKGKAPKQPAETPPKEEVKNM